MKTLAGKPPSTRKSLDSRQEQQVPRSRLQKSSLDDSSNSTPSSPSSSSYLADDLFPTSPTPISPKFNGVHAETQPEMPSKNNLPVISSKSSPKSNGHVNGQKNVQNKIIGQKKSTKDESGGNTKREAKSVDLISNSSSEIDRRAELALQSLMPLFDRLPNDAVFGEDILVQARTPDFATHCASAKVDQPLHLMPSHLIRHMTTYLEMEKKQEEAAESGGAFKRPRSPHGTERWTKKTKGVPQQAEGGRAATAAELKERMRNKLNAFRAKRKALLEPDDLADMMELRRKLKRMKKKEKLHKKKSQNRHKPVAGESSQSKVSTPSTSRSSSVVSDNGKMIFSKFDFFGDESGKPNAKQTPGKNLTHLLNKSEAQTKRMAELQASDPEAAKRVAEKQAWSEAVLKAQGVKLKNDPVKLKHALKEQKKRKEKSKKKWEARKQDVGRQQKQKTEKREKNLDERKSKGAEKKRKRHIKKGHVIPGFN